MGNARMVYNIFYFLWPENDVISSRTKSIITNNDEDLQRELISAHLESEI